MKFSRWPKAQWWFWRASAGIISTIWRVVLLQDMWRPLLIQMMTQSGYDIWGSDTQMKNLCKLLQSKDYWKVSEPANWIFVSIMSSERRLRWNSAQRLTAPREFGIVYTDIWESAKTASIGGAHYFVTFIDNYSRRCWVYTKKHKGEVLELFVEWKKNLKKSTGRKIKVL